MCWATYNVIATSPLVAADYPNQRPQRPPPTQTNSPFHLSTTNCNHEVSALPRTIIKMSYPLQMVNSSMFAFQPQRNEVESMQLTGAISPRYDEWKADMDVHMSTEEDPDTLDTIPILTDDECFLAMLALDLTPLATSTGHEPHLSKYTHWNTTTTMSDPDLKRQRGPDVWDPSVDAFVDASVDASLDTLTSDICSIQAYFSSENFAQLERELNEGDMAEFNKSVNVGSNRMIRSLRGRRATPTAVSSRSRR
ncbi:hypothetical protein BC936DRAFT_139246 [Jimgerdemannia flammicorona]|uniref:Uncharacterized protein n=1 Tax=Jimgerdemannia flammicorona TaxID=994334 RepID=A0A433BAB4_9FUNG|nr:hypothetical protein BC936DRAFT_139246 [Jimgerdemannia flammicorona]